MWSDWAGNKIGVGGARGLGDALKTNTTLTVLWLSCEHQDHKETTREQGKHNGAWCDWADNGLGDEGGEALREALQTNTALTELVI